MNYEVVDVGTNEDVPCDYPIYAEKAALLVNSKKCEFGILICSSELEYQLLLIKLMA